VILIGFTMIAVRGGTAGRAASCSSPGRFFGPSAGAARAATWAATGGANVTTSMMFALSVLLRALPLRASSRSSAARRSRSSSGRWAPTCAFDA
jgi:hypothetical protein